MASQSAYCSVGTAPFGATGNEGVHGPGGAGSPGGPPWPTGAAKNLARYTDPDRACLRWRSERHGERGSDGRERHSWWGSSSAVCQPSSDKENVPKEGRMDQQQRRASADRRGKTGDGGAAPKNRQSESQALDRAGCGNLHNGPSRVSDRDSVESFSEAA